ncbi:DUF4149 domain-containing protein [Hymenobacter crusticola]|uniref:Uncharacterized protein n=1 Tax=Hymenobacter crusticola TaxID=1770526 RepID=A0A243W639_9BACT|nr:DUF4149 domain-containing protein [Hymenobacter crusticola]OUJ68977.1 hypothetical protein BXP70_27110 [Hymenobacter crusticola]
MSEVDQIFQDEIIQAIDTIRKNLDNTDYTLALISQLSEEIINYYNRFVISGRYIESNYAIPLKEVKQSIESLYSYIFGCPHEIEHSINSVREILEEANNALSVLHTRANSTDSGKSYLSEYSYFNKLGSNNIFAFGLSSYSLFIQNIKLAFFDHFLAVKTEQLEELSQINEELSSTNLAQTKYTSIVLDKCNYLLYKILFRLSKDENSYVYLYNNKDNEIDIETVKSRIVHFKPFLEVTESHYSDQANAQQSWINPVIAKKGRSIKQKLSHKENINVEEYHTLIKFSKDINHSKDEVKGIKNSFFDIEKGNTLTAKFDTKAFNINKNYIYNNLLSSSIDNKESLATVREILNEIVDLQNTTSIKNYFPFFKTSEYFNDTIEKYFSSLAITKYEKLEEIEAIIHDYRNIINQCYQTFKWCNDRNYTAFQLPFNECIKTTKVDGEDQAIFLSSSFVLPINYRDIDTQLSKLDRDYNRIKTQIALYKTVKQERTEIERIKTLLTSEVVEKDRKQIEILGIFAAIVLFSVSEVQLFSKVTSIAQAMMFSISFAYSLGIFIILLWLITRNYDVKISTVHWIVISLFVCITIILYITLVGWEILNRLL